MRTTVEIDDDLWARASKAAPSATKRALIERGLQALVDQAARRRAIALTGSMPDIDPVPRKRFGGEST